MVSFKKPSEFREKMQKCQEYIGALDEELKKIRVFERELPLCLELVSQAIERCKQQMSETTMITEPFNGQSDHYFCDQTSSEYPVLEEFIPMKSTSSTNEDIDDQEQQKQQLSNELFTGSKDWLASAQLSIQAPDPIYEEDLFMKKLTMDEQRNGCDSFHTFEKKKISISSSSDTDGGGGGGNDGGDKGRSNKKERRCWSPELHRRFLHALQQLGGAHVATPKQIREIMKVNGLTNDEIKSHLQKYRLHTRRLNPTIENVDTHTPQLAVVGRIWMPPQGYTPNASSSPLTNGVNSSKVVYAPIASLPPSIIASSYKTKQRI
ncbi:putative transcription factor MYB-HB-like family [Helianthus annuus]|uniref:Transcription factor MYB-related family n=1 Tax=Helianthus annuus TaxID=4232 RepID=A0A9K3IC94_HELAN|nr:transcription factor HHO3-like [Helianthus annuus]KAF5794132.1 putative transcription factor MYB-related family [Helianthus annuus]KAJ0537846.1 putative transcription factor MYB-HB-like family [Helianthus annuus]KAJ0552434.1 putative transcription factor MYB-HB-like family [Helianthus annuus]KAJ0721369.1 putative transcription factor MYB-HB-like family [Helianthus annuus]KAJ0896558.1 putative transcription factor MYB-HB-like family [Helianthus annuus]